MQQYIYKCTCIRQYSIINYDTVSPGMEVQFVSTRRIEAPSAMTFKQEIADAYKRVYGITIDPNWTGLSSCFKVVNETVMEQKANNAAKLKRHTQRRSNSSTGNGGFLRWLFMSSWKWSEDAGVFGKTWHVIKTLLRIAIFVVIFILLCVGFTIISSIIKEAR